jgi:D-serine dehydratase
MRAETALAKVCGAGVAVIALRDIATGGRTLPEEISVLEVGLDRRLEHADGLHIGGVASFMTDEHS